MKAEGVGLLGRERSPRRVPSEAPARLAFQEGLLRSGAAIERQTPRRIVFSVRLGSVPLASVALRAEGRLLSAFVGDRELSRDQCHGELSSLSSRIDADRLLVDGEKRFPGYWPHVFATPASAEPTEVFDLIPKHSSRCGVGYGDVRSSSLGGPAWSVSTEQLRYDVTLRLSVPEYVMLSDVEVLFPETDAIQLSVLGRVVLSARFGGAVLPKPTLALEEACGAATRALSCVVPKAVGLEEWESVFRSIDVGCAAKTPEFDGAVLPADRRARPGVVHLKLPSSGISAVRDFLCERFRFGSDTVLKRLKLAVSGDSDMFLWICHSPRSAGPPNASATELIDRRVRGDAVVFLATESCEEFQTLRPDDLDLVLNGKRVQQRYFVYGGQL